MEGHVRRGSLVGPVILIGAGLIFLLNNLGVLGWNVWEGILRFWPILLIAIGLDILVGRRSVLGSLLVVVLLLGALSVAVLFAVPGTTAANVLTTEQITQPLNGASRADVDIRMGAGMLRLGALDESAGLIEGRVGLSRNEKVTQDFHVAGNTAHYELASRGAPVWWPGGGFRAQDWTDKVWDLKLTRDVPLQLNINTGVGESVIDLSYLQVTDLDINTGVGQVTLTTPRSGRVAARLDGGIGEVRVRIPAEMAARIEVKGGLGQTDVRGDFRRQGDVYTSPGYETAQDRLDLKINGGIGQVTVEFAGG